MTKKIAIRVDASPQIGAGHVVRSLALAHELTEAGFRIAFVAREMPSPLQELVKNAGHALHMLPPVPERDMRQNEGSGTCAHWLQAPWRVDAEHTLAAIRVLGIVEWLVIDHYAIDEHWEKAVRSEMRRILVLDDLADRPHECDLLVDQLVMREAQDYTGLVPDSCRVLTGASNALLRPEFRRLRPSALKRRQKPHALNRVLVILGGGTSEEFLLQILDAVASVLPESVNVDLALGTIQVSEERLAGIRKILGERGILHDFSASIARLMHDADLAIGASGMSNYERCCLGLPSIQFVQAENQRRTAEYFHRSGAALTIDADGPSFFQDLQHAIEQLAADDSLRGDMARRAAAMVDGKGAKRIREAMGEA